jgi:phosphoglucomutase
MDQMKSEDGKEFNMESAIKKAETGINEYLGINLKEDKIDKQSYDQAKENTFANLKKWLTDPNIDSISPNLKTGILEAIAQEKWENIVNAFRKDMSFGTAGIRGLMANDKESIIKLKEEGIDAKILKGPNTLNNIVLLIASAGVAKFGKDKGFKKVVIGYDSRIRGFDFAKCIAELFLGYGFTVYLFDAPCPYPEVTFAIPYEKVKADMGILISASHNDYRYNGYKLSCGNGSQFDPEERDIMYKKYIVHTTTEDIKLLPIKDVTRGQIIFLGGDKKLDNFDYFGHEDSIINIHKAHRDHIKTFLLQEQNSDKKLNIAYCAFHGAGIIAVPRLLQELSFKNIKTITKNGLSELNGLFPSFSSEPGREQQPDPGDPRAAKVAVEAFKEEFPGEWQNMEILIGTDPDADRCGVVVKVPADQKFLYKDNDYALLTADDMWALLIWYRLKFDKTIDPEKTFVALSTTTTDSIVKLALKHGIGIVKTWVGFAALSAAVRQTWDKELPEGLIEGKKYPNDALCNIFIQETINMDNGKRQYNLGAMEQSNGFSILGFPPEDEFSLGVKGHVRDKDGTFAAVLIAEIAEWAKQNDTTLFELIDKNIYLDPDIGLFVNYYEPDPLDGEYPGIEGDRIKKSILSKTLELSKTAVKGGLEIGGLSVKSTVIYRTGKYDHIYTPSKDFQFPDEGVRFYFDAERLNHLTVRPSGTTNSLRFHIQLHSAVDEHDLIEKKGQLRQLARNIADHIRDKVGAPRNSELV